MAKRMISTARTLAGTATLAVAGVVALFLPAVLPVTGLNAATRSFSTDAFESYRTRNFDVKNEDPEMAERVGAALEDALSRPVFDGLLPSVDNLGRVITVMLYPTTERFAASTDLEQSGGGSMAKVSGNKAKATKIVLDASQPGLIESIVPHELAHARFYESDLYHNNVPSWVSEGIAVAAESEDSRNARAALMKRALDSEELAGALELMATENPPNENRSLFYAEAYAAAAGLVNAYGSEKFAEFIAAVRYKSQTDALVDIYGIQPVDLEDLMLEWLEAHVPKDEGGTRADGEPIFIKEGSGIAKAGGNPDQ